MAKYVEFGPVSISCISSVVTSDQPAKKQAKEEKPDCLSCAEVLQCAHWFDKAKCKFSNSAEK